MINNNVKQSLTFLAHLMFLAWCALLLGIPAQAENLTASVDRDTIGLEETFTLRLRYDAQVNATPDYDLLRRHFDILSTQSGTNMTIVNGRTEASTEWVIALAPKKIGKWLIPSFNIQGAVSDAIEITVEGKSRTPKQGGDNVSVELETDKDSAYVQEQIIVTVRLYTAVALSGVNLEPLNVPNALIVQLDEKQYQTNINNRPHIVAETRYALYPQKSGELVIPSLLYQVSVDNGQSGMWNRLYGNNNNVLRLRTDEQHLTVSPAPTTTPDGAKDQPWIPAKNITLKEHWSAGIDTLKVGEPITRSITLLADGLTAGQIPPLVFEEVEGLTFYQDQAQTDDQKNEQGNVGTRIETIAIIPNRSGDFTLPAINVHWWDTQEKTVKTATLDSVTLHVDSGVAQPSEPSALTPPDTDSGANSNINPDTTEVSINTDPSSITPQMITTVNIPLWVYFCNLATLLSTLVFAVLYWQKKRELAAVYATDQLDQNENTQQEYKAWNHFKAQFSTGELAPLRTALINWAQAFWNDKKLINLQLLCEKAGNPSLTEQLKKLDAEIYSGHAQGFDPKTLLELISNLRRKKNKTTAESQLQPLYKN